MKRTKLLKSRSSVVASPLRRAAHSNTVAAAVASILWGTTGAAFAQTPTTTADTTANATASGDEATLETIIVTGTTSKRTLLNSSADVTLDARIGFGQSAPAASRYRPGSWTPITIYLGGQGGRGSNV